MSSPLFIDLHLTRASSAEDPFGFSVGQETYHRLSPNGTVDEGRLPWASALQEQLRDWSRTPDRATGRTIGATLRRFLADVGWDIDENSITAALQEGRPVVLSLRLAAAELFALPWDRVELGRTGRALGDVPELLIQAEWPGNGATPAPARPSRLLLAYTRALQDLGRAHQQALGPLAQSAGVDWSPLNDVLPAASLLGLRDRLAEAERAGRPFTTLLLLAHGEADHIQLDTAEQREEAVDGRRLLGALTPFPDLLLLAACSAGHMTPGNRVSGVALDLHRAGVPAVLASPQLLSARGALTLTEALCSGLWSQRSSLGDAVRGARDRLVLQSPEDRLVLLRRTDKTQDRSAFWTLPSRPPEVSDPGPKPTPEDPTTRAPSSPEPSRPSPPAPAPTAPAGQRTFAPWKIALGLVLLLLLALGVASWFTLEPSELQVVEDQAPPPEPGPPPQTAGQAPWCEALTHKAPQEQRLTEEKVHKASIDLAHRMVYAWTQHNSAWSLRSWTLDSHGEAKQQPGEPLLRSASASAGELRAGAGLLFTDKGVWLAPGGGAALKLQPSLRAEGVFALHPDGALLAYSTEQSVLLGPLGEPGKPLSSALGASVQSMAFSDDGARLALGLRDGRVIVLALNGEKLAEHAVFERTDNPDNQGVAIGLAFSPDGQQLAIGGVNGALATLDLGSGEVSSLAYHNLQTDHVQRLALSAQGERLVSSSSDRVLLSVLSGRQHCVLSDQAALDIALDGEQVWLIAADGVLRRHALPSEDTLYTLGFVDE